MEILILSGYGLNCEEETLFAFEQAAINLNQKVKVKIVHVNDLVKNINKLKACNILAIPGGFSYGDYTGSGNAFALHILNNLRDEFQECLIQDKLIIGICNGCQVLLKLVPDFKNITLTYNVPNQYQCRWVRVKVNNTCPSIWLHDLKELYIPVAHGEGQFIAPQEIFEGFLYDNCIALQYVNEQGNIADQVFPINPNGSKYDIAALSSRNGKVLAMMPHPERALFFTQQDNWPLLKEQYIRSHTSLPIYGDGYSIFHNAIKYFL